MDLEKLKARQKKKELLMLNYMEFIEAYLNSRNTGKIENLNMSCLPEDEGYRVQCDFVYEYDEYGDEVRIPVVGVGNDLFGAIEDFNEGVRLAWCFMAHQLNVQE